MPKFYNSQKKEKKKHIVGSMRGQQQFWDCIGSPIDAQCKICALKQNQLRHHIIFIQNTTFRIGIHQISVVFIQLVIGIQNDPALQVLFTQNQ